MRLPARRIVLVNAMVPKPGETFGRVVGCRRPGSGQSRLRRVEGRDPDAEFDLVESFFHDVPAEVTAEAFARGEPEQAESALAAPWPLDAWPDVPTTAITGRHDRLFPEALQRGYLRDRLGIEPTVIDGGHLVALSNPEGLAAVLLEQAG